MQSLILLLAILAGGLPVQVFGQSLSQLAKQQGCTSTPVIVDGTDLYKCQTPSAMSYFSGPASGNGPSQGSRKSNAGNSKAPTPANFPRVNSTTQHGRDDVRKRVLSEELATETRMLAESEAGLKAGMLQLPDESPSNPKYLDRVAKLKQTVENHNRNIQALNRELDRLR